MRSITKGPIFSKKLDSYDFDDIHMNYEELGTDSYLFIQNRGFDFCQYFNFSKQLDQLSYLGKYVSKPCEAMAFVPRRALNTANGEVAKALCLHGRQAEYVSFNRTDIDEFAFGVDLSEDPEPLSF